MQDSKKYITYLTEDPDLFAFLEDFYSVVEAAKQSAYESFVKTSLSPKDFKRCIRTEVTFLSKLKNSYANVDLPTQTVSVSLDHLYRYLKSSHKKYPERFSFFHVNRLRNAKVFLFPFFSVRKKDFSFSEDVFTLYGKSIEAPYFSLVLENPVRKLVFVQLGHFEIDGKKFENVTEIRAYPQGKE